MREVNRDCSFDDVGRRRRKIGGRQKAEDFEFWLIERGENQATFSDVGSGLPQAEQDQRTKRAEKARMEECL